MAATLFWKGEPVTAEEMTLWKNKSGLNGGLIHLRDLASPHGLENPENSRLSNSAEVEILEISNSKQPFIPAAAHHKSHRSEI